MPSSLVYQPLVEQCIVMVSSNSEVTIIGDVMYPLLPPPQYLHPCITMLCWLTFLSPSTASSTYSSGMSDVGRAALKRNGSTDRHKDGGSCCVHCCLVQ